MLLVTGVAVPLDDLNTIYCDMQKPDDFPAFMLLPLSHFFEHPYELESANCTHSAASVQPAAGEEGRSRRGRALLGIRSEEY